MMNATSGKFVLTPSCSPYLLRRTRSLREVCRAIHRGDSSPCTPCAYRKSCQAIEANREANPGDLSIPTLAPCLQEGLHQNAPIPMPRRSEIIAETPPS